MRENYTDKARAALTVAERAAASGAGGRLGTEHLLLGVLSARECVAEVVLSAMGVDIESMRLVAGRTVEKEELPTSASTEQATAVAVALRYAKEEAQASDHSLIGTQHLLLGLMREGQGRAASVLAEAGVKDLTSVRQQIALMLNLNARRPDVSAVSDDSSDSDDPLLSRARIDLSEVRFAKQRAISNNDHDLALRLRDKEKEILRVIAELRAR